MGSRDEIPCSSWRYRTQSRFVSQSRDALFIPSTLRSPSPHPAIGSAPYLHTETGTGNRSFAAASVFRLCVNLNGDCYDSALTTGLRNSLLTRTTRTTRAVLEDMPRDYDKSHLANGGAALPSTIGMMVLKISHFSRRTR